MRFGFPNTLEMQDWEWEVADSQRIGEFLSVYESGELTEDEQFILMETILQSFENLESPPQANKHWQQVLDKLDKNVELHIYTLWYWARGNFDISPLLRPLFERHRSRFDQSNSP